MIALSDIPMKKGSVAVTVSRHMRGSIEDISKIKYFIITGAKIQKKQKANIQIKKFF